MTDHEGDEPDPLLVRPFLLHDSGALDDTPSTQTWPSATREVRSHRVLTGAPLTGRPRPAAKSPYPRRFLVVTATGVAVLAAVTAAGYAALGPGFRPSVSAALPGTPLPAVTGPPTTVPSPSSAQTTGTSPRAAVSSSVRRSGPSATRTTTAAPSAGAPASSGPPAGAGVTASAGVPTSAGVSTSPTTGDGDGQVTVGPAPPAGLAPSPTADRTGTIGGRNNLCLDLNGGVPVDDNHVQVFDCNGTDAQRWTLAADGTLRVVGKCALVVGDGTVHIVSCDGRTTARWRIAGRTLVNAANARCLTDPAAGTRAGAGVTVTRCSGSAEQSWNLP
jgi:ricin-type beta-trefoil lectin protein